LSNRLLQPLQALKTDLETHISVAEIRMLQTDTATERFDDAVDQLELAIQNELARVARAEQAARDAALAANRTPPSAPSAEVAPPKAQPPVVAKPKPVVEVNVAEIYSKTCQGLYLDSDAAVEQFVDALKAELQRLVDQQHRVRIR
jgi:hypothetical protein